MTIAVAGTELRRNGNCACLPLEGLRRAWSPSATGTRFTSSATPIWFDVLAQALKSFQFPSETTSIVSPITLMAVSSSIA